MLDPAAARNTFADDLVAEYQRLELILLELIADKVARGLDAPDWAARQVMELQRFRKEAGVIAAKMAGKSPELIASAIQRAVTDGFLAASQDIAIAEGISAGQVVVNAGTVPAIDGPAIAALLAETTGALTAVDQGVLRATDDIYRKVVARGAATVVAGAETRKQATQRALTEFTRNGITGFLDRRGKSWSLTAYTEMAIRTGTTKALMQSHSNRLTERGYDLVIVSSHPRPAPQCQPYERQILSLSGRTLGVISETSRLTGRTVSVKVKASLAEAESKGLHHPACRHRHSLYIPGVTDTTPTKADDEGYADTQELRRLERGVREWKRRAATSLDPAEKKAAQAKVREWQGKIKAHTETTGVGRRRDREQLDLGNKTPTLDVAAKAPKVVKPKPAPKAAAIPLDVEYSPKLSALAKASVERQTNAIPAAARASIQRAGTKVVVARNTGETSLAAQYAGKLTADGRAMETESFYSPTANHVFINANDMQGSVNVIAHELAHSMDLNHLKGRPARVEVQNHGEAPYIHTVSELADDPYLIWAHRQVRDTPHTSKYFDYFKQGSAGNPQSGRREWIAESYAAVVEGRDDVLVNVAGGSVEAADIIRWSFGRLGVL
ncbi:phage minor capsid protein [Rhodococcus sp. NPDC006774]|uniref:phage minor capsid protein n=1 Tax=Rhodococcus sp. NPDC006774 TaxID=3157186 RepID=UPI0033F33066